MNASAPLPNSHNVERPISATMLGLAVIGLIVVLLPSIRKKREEAFTEES